MSKTELRQRSKASERGRVCDAQAAFADLLIDSSRPGFYGTVSLTLRVQDGFIQHVSVATERVVR